MVNTMNRAAEGGSFATLLRGFELLGLSDLLGCAGEYTAFQAAESVDGYVTYHVLPGRMTPDELIELIEEVVPKAADKSIDVDVLELPFVQRLAA